MDNYQKEQNEILKVIKEYSEGIYLGDTTLLENTFSTSAILYGDLPSGRYIKPVDEYLSIVGGRKSPKEQGDVFSPEVLSIEVWGQVAYVKAHVPMLGYNYYDFLSLFKTEQGWKIVNKMFIHVEPN